jgi:hypothetical protein
VPEGRSWTFYEVVNEAEQAMAKDGPIEIYMIKKSADGFIVSFRLGTDQGITPGMDLVVLNEDGFQVGHVTVLSSTEKESEALVAGESGIKLGCRVSLPAAARGV